MSYLNFRAESTDSNGASSGDGLISKVAVERLHGRSVSFDLTTLLGERPRKHHRSKSQAFLLLNMSSSELEKTAANFKLLVRNEGSKSKARKYVEYTPRCLRTGTQKNCHLAISGCKPAKSLKLGYSIALQPSRCLDIKTMAPYSPKDSEPVPLPSALITSKHKLNRRVLMNQLRDMPVPPALTKFHSEPLLSPCIPSCEIIYQNVKIERVTSERTGNAESTLAIPELERSVSVPTVENYQSDHKSGGEFYSLVIVESAISNSPHSESIIISQVLLSFHSFSVLMYNHTKRACGEFCTWRDRNPDVVYILQCSANLIALYTVMNFICGVIGSIFSRSATGTF